MNKKLYGQFFTSDTIANFMSELVCAHSPKSILEPAVGSGNLLKFLDKYTNYGTLWAFDIDPCILQTIPSDIRKRAEIFCQDYLTTDIQNRFDAIIANPPYHKFQQIKNRQTLLDLYNKKYSVVLNGSTNLYIYFLIKSLNELNVNGRCCYIIPYEFLNTAYGEKVKEYLLQTKKLVSIIKFSTDLQLFDDAITTSCIVLLENAPHDYVDFINVSNMEEIKTKDFSQICRMSYDKLNPKEKWLKYFCTTNECEPVNTKLVPFAEYAKVKRGIASGCNSFFCLNREKIKTYGLSKSVCMPCLTKAPDIDHVIMTEQYFNALYEQNKYTHLFDGKQACSNNDFEYIKSGEAQNVDKLFLTSHRNPWFSIENKDAAPILISVFSRNRIKVIRNEYGIKNLTTFHGVFPIKQTAKDDIDILFCYLLTPVAQKILFLNKREYGSGLNKFEPNDFNNAKILNLELISKGDKEQILHIYNKLLTSNVDEQECITALDKVFAAYL